MLLNNNLKINKFIFNKYLSEFNSYFIVSLNENKQIIDLIKNFGYYNIFQITQYKKFILSFKGLNILNGYNMYIVFVQEYECYDCIVDYSLFDLIKNNIIIVCYNNYFLLNYNYDLFFIDDKIYSILIIYIYILLNILNIFFVKLIFLLK